MSPDPYFYFIFVSGKQIFQRKTLVIEMMNVGGRAIGQVGVNNSFPKHNSTTVRNILMILGRIIEQVRAECRIQELQLCLSPLTNYVCLSIFLLHFCFHLIGFLKENSSY